jgi:acyl carrier protein
MNTDTETENRKVLVQLLSQIAPEIEREADIDPDQKLREQVDLDSMDFLNFIISVANRFETDIPERDYGRLTTLNDFVRYVSDPREKC